MFFKKLNTYWRCACNVSRKEAPGRVSNSRDRVHGDPPPTPSAAELSGVTCRQRRVTTGGTKSKPVFFPDFLCRNSCSSILNCYCQWLASSFLIRSNRPKFLRINISDYESPKMTFFSQKFGGKLVPPNF